MKNLKTNGLFLALVASIISGIAIFYAKISVIKVDPLVLTTGRNFIAGLLFIIFIGVSQGRKELKKLTKKQFINLILITLIGGVIPFYLFFSGLKYVQVPIANIIQKSLFIWVSLLAVVFLKEKLNIKYWLSFALIVLANFYFTKLPLNWGKGELMILGATLFWSVENVLAKKILKEISSELIGLFRMGLGSSILFVLTFTTGKGNALLSLNNQQLTIILVGGFILFTYVYFWYKALKFAPASLVTLILTFSVVIINILAGSFLGIKLLPTDIYSSLLIGIAIVLINYQPLRLQLGGHDKLK